MSVGVVILGMHRSGTSALARVVNLLGVPINVEHDWMPVQPDNPTGYWESAALVQCNNEILASCRGTSTSPPAFTRNWQYDAILEPLVARAVSSFRSVYPTGDWVWKDPRTCLTLPFWRRVLGDNLVALIVYRNPLEVARSLGLRDGLSKAHCLALWESYVRATLVHAQGLPTVVIRYEDLLSQPTIACAELREFLSASGLVLDEPNLLCARGFLDAELRHHSINEATLESDPDILPTQAQLFATLQAIRGTHPAFDSPPLPDESVWINDLHERNQMHERAMRDHGAQHTLAQEGNAWLDGERRRWQQLAEAQTDTLLELESRLRAIQDGKEWLEQQRSQWQHVAAERHQIIVQLQSSLRDIQAGSVWLERERGRWQEVAESQTEIIRELQGRLGPIQEGTRGLERQCSRSEEGR